MTVPLPAEIDWGMAGRLFEVVKHTRSFMNITIIGLGYVGQSLALPHAQRHDVVALDIA